MTGILTRLLSLAIVSSFCLLQVVAQIISQGNQIGKAVYDPLKSGNEVRLDVEYKKVGDMSLKMDVFYPDSRPLKAYPLVVFTHGGGWAGGSKKLLRQRFFAQLLKELLEKDFCVVSVDYRLFKKNAGNYIRDCVVDSKDAIRFLAKNSDEFSIDKNRIYTIGSSAGGHIAQLLLLSPDDAFVGDEKLAKEKYTVLAGVSWFGPSDFEETTLFEVPGSSKPSIEVNDRISDPSLNAEKRLEMVREISPVNYLSENSHPLLMIQGDKDKTIPVQHAYYMKERAEKVNAPVETLIVKNAGHSWKKAGGELNPGIDEIIRVTVDFICKH